MTIQISDTVQYEGTMYSLLTQRGNFFDPAEYGLFPECAIPYAQRGWFCHCVIRDDQLFLENLNIHTQGDVYPLLNGRKAETSTEHCLDEHHRHYRNTALPVSFTGRMILARDPDYSYFRPGTNLDPWGYRTVLELTFAEGVLTGAEDRSGAAAAVRTAIEREGCRDNAYDFVKTLPEASEENWWLL